MSQIIITEKAMRRLCEVIYNEDIEHYAKVIFPKDKHLQQKAERYRENKVNDTAFLAFISNLDSENMKIFLESLELYPYNKRPS